MDMKRIHSLVALIISMLLHARQLCTSHPSSYTAIDSNALDSYELLVDINPFLKLLTTILVKYFNPDKNIVIGL